MTKLTEYTSYVDAQRHFSPQALWDLFDGDRDRLNIAHECVDRHAGTSAFEAAAQVDDDATPSPAIL